MSQEIVKVLVVGAGIGGLSAAIALGEAGHELHVVEIQPDLHSSVYGVGIIQPVNALRALERIGCAEQCMELGYAASAWARMLDTDGNLLRDIPGARIPGSDLPPMNGITRPLLHKILTDRALECGATIVYGETVTALDQESDSVTVTYSDASSATFDLVVGADGVRSAIRQMVMDESVKPMYNGQSAFRINIPRDPEIDRIILQPGAGGEMAGFVPIGPDLAYMFFNSSWDRDQRPPEEEYADIVKDKLRQYRGGLAARVRDNYIDDSATIVFRPEEWLVAPQPWHRGHVVLLGDAVHAVTPHLGQGAAQAIEDGVVLAEVLGEHDSLEAALQAFSERRYERCKFIVEASLQLGEWMKHPSPDADHAGLTQRAIESMVAPI